MVLRPEAPFRIIRILVPLACQIKFALYNLSVPVFEQAPGWLVVKRPVPFHSRYKLERRPYVFGLADSLKLQADPTPIMLQELFDGFVSVQQVFSLCYDFNLDMAINSGPCSIGAYTTGDNGNVVRVLDNLDSTRSTIYTYDPLNRIAQANTINTTSSNCWGEIYSIDPWSNLYSRGGVSGMTGCLYEALSATPSTNNQLSILTYDAAGNVTNDGNGNTPIYDAENRIATDAGVTYSYDADGARMEKSSGTMYWPGPSGATLTETDLTGTVNEEYIYFNGARIARVDRPSGTVHYYFSDHLGSASVITDALGNITKQDFYFPYGGEITTSTGSDPNHYKFTGKERDTESNLDMFGARYYGSGLGRFMTPDWAEDPDPVPYADLRDPQSLNLYGYVRNNPTSFTDEDGHECHSLPNGDVVCNVSEPLPPEFPGVIAVAATTLPFDWESPPGWLVGGGIALSCAATPSCRQAITNIFNQKTKDKDTSQTDTSKTGNKIPHDAADANGAKAPGKPGANEGFKDPKTGPQWGKARNGKYGWVDAKGNVWVPTGQSPSLAHGGPHWDVQLDGGGYQNVRPGGNLQ